MSQTPSQAVQGNIGQSDAFLVGPPFQQRGTNVDSSRCASRLVPWLRARPRRCTIGLEGGPFAGPLPSSGIAAVLPAVHQFAILLRCAFHAL